MINEAKIRQQVKRGIAKKPTHIELMRIEKVSNGMRGTVNSPTKVADLDIFFDDSKRNYVVDSVKEVGYIKRNRGISILAVTDGFEIKVEDYFIDNGMKYTITYPGMIVGGVYNADVEVSK